MIAHNDGSDWTSCVCDMCEDVRIETTKRANALPCGQLIQGELRRPKVMKLPVPSEGGFSHCPPGNHLAVCYEILDLGTQQDTYEGKTMARRKLFIGWEIPEETMPDGRPFVISKFYHFSSHEKATLRHDLESWRGCKFKDEDFGPQGKFDIKNVIGKGCFLSVIEGDNGKTKVQSVASLPKGTTSPQLINEPNYLSLDPSDFDQNVFESLRDGLQAIIADSPEYQSIIKMSRSGHVTATKYDETDDNLVPF